MFFYFVFERLSYVPFGSLPSFADCTANLPKVKNKETLKFESGFPFAPQVSSCVSPRKKKERPDEPSQTKYSSVGEKGKRHGILRFQGSQRQTDPRAKIEEAIFCTRMTATRESIRRTINGRRCGRDESFLRRLKESLVSLARRAAAKLVVMKLIACEDLSLWPLPRAEMRQDTRLFSFLCKEEEEDEEEIAAETSLMFHVGVT